MTEGKRGKKEDLSIDISLQDNQVFSVTQCVQTLTKNDCQHA